jgi:spermidine synthase
MQTIVTRRPPLSELALYAGIGAAALMLEVGWTRLYGMIFLRTEYVLAVILCVFLIGLGAGSLAVRGRDRPGWLSVLPLLAAALVILGLWLFPLAAAWADRHQDYASLAAALWRQGAVIMVLTLPVTLLLGAWLPLLGNRREAGGHGAGAWLYGANSAGAAAGALVGGFLLIPWLGTMGTLILAALILLGCGAALVGARRMGIAIPLLLLLAWPVRSLPPVDRLQPATLPEARDLAVYEDALAITHVVAQRDGQRLLLADLRRMDASSDPTAVVAQQDQARLPLLLHPAPHQVLFLGLGTGISAAGALAFPLASLTAVEVSRGAIQAARRWFPPVNDDVMDRIEVVRDDARRFLRAGDERYDVIIGDLFHPDLVGRGNLLSVQQFARARARLAPGGLFVQWLALNQFDLRSLRIVLRSFGQAFPDGRLFMDGFRLALVGPRDRWPAAGEMVAAVAERPGPQQEAMTGGEGVWTWLGRYWGKIPKDAGPVEDEWRPKVEFLLPRARYSGEVDLAGLLDYLLASRPPLDQAESDLKLAPDQAARFEPAYIAAELALRSWAAGLRNSPLAEAEAQRLLRAAYEANPKDRWIGFSLADRMLESLPQAVAAGRDRRSALLAVLAVRPDHVGALKALWRLETEAGNTEQAAAYRTRVQALSPLDRETAGGA